MGCVSGLLGLPAELYPQIGQSARMQSIKLRITGYVNGSFGLPAELYPHILSSLAVSPDSFCIITYFAEMSSVFSRFYFSFSRHRNRKNFGKYPLPFPGNSRYNNNGHSTMFQIACGQISGGFHGSTDSFLK